MDLRWTGSYNQPNHWGSYRPILSIKTYLEITYEGDDGFPTRLKTENFSSTLLTSLFFPNSGLYTKSLQFPGKKNNSTSTERSKSQ